jgi:ACS family hexuronate transporter-like MFS transporter
MMRIPHLRWWIAAMLFLASVLNYLDRQTLSILAPTIQRELSLTDQDYAFVVNLFMVAYTVATILSGRLVDRLGVRVSLALFVGWWSIANLLTGFARSIVSLGLFRFLLGLGEAGNWTAAPKAVADWFPPKERGIAIGVYTLGATIGATIAPLLILAIASRHGWQSVFVVTGVAGLAWIVPWLWLYRRPAEHPRLSDAERAYITGVSAAAAGEAAVADERPDPGAAKPGARALRGIESSAPEGWRAVLRRREVWLLMLTRLLTDPVWYFYQFWFAKYLYGERGVSQLGLSITFVIFLAADLGALGGGWFSGQLIKRHHTPPASRLRIMAAAACLMPLSALVPHVSALPVVLAIGMAIVFAHMSWLINLSALIVDLVPQRSLATSFGVIAAGSALGGMMMNWAVGRLVTNYSYAPAFFVMACVHPLAMLLAWRLRKAPQGDSRPGPVG